MTPTTNPPPLLHQILSAKEFGPILTSPNLPRVREEWRATLRNMARAAPGSDELARRFHDQWHVCHHFVRKIIDDDALILDMLWTWLPRHDGPGLTLYRGENLQRLGMERVGFAWSDNMVTAHMFASGLNAVNGGGALLRAEVPPSAVIAGPSRHSLWLGESEFTVDPRRLARIELVARFAEVC